MRFLTITFLAFLLTSCSSEEPSSSVTKLKELTERKELIHIDTLETPIFVKEFYLVQSPPESIDEFKKLMLNVSETNLHPECRDEKFVFVRNPMSTNYLKDQSGGIDAADILGTILYENKRQRREITINTDEDSFYGGDTKGVRW